MILTPTLTFTAKDGRLASYAVKAFDSIEAGERAIDAALKRAKAEGGSGFALRLRTPDGDVSVYRWFDADAGE